MNDSLIRLSDDIDRNSHDFLSTTFPKNYPSHLRQLQEATKYKFIIEEEAQKFEIQSCIIAGLGSRESEWGLALNPQGQEGTGDFAPRIKIRAFRTTPLPSDGLGFGRGLLQIDYDYHEFARSGGWKDHKDNIFYGCKLLFDNRKFLQLKFNLNNNKLLRATLASYNAGLKKIQKAILEGFDLDYFTTGRNYSQNVLNRAGWFFLQGWS